MRAPHEVIRDRLAVYLGPHTARNAIRTFSAKALGMSAEEVTIVDTPKLLDSMRPMLKTLVGAAQCDRILELLNHELGLRS